MSTYDPREDQNLMPGARTAPGLCGSSVMLSGRLRYCQRPHGHDGSGKDLDSFHLRRLDDSTPIVWRDAQEGTKVEIVTSVARQEPAGRPSGRGKASRKRA